MKIRLWAECLILYAALPASTLLLRNREFMILMFWLGAPLAALALGRWHKVRAWEEWNWAAVRPHLRAVLVLFAVVAPIVALVAWRLLPGQFLMLPRSHPALWLCIALLYPPLSVLPQEIIFRSWFFHRYRPILPGPQAVRLGSAIAFGAYHTIFLSPVSVVLTLLAGYGFARSYDKSKSLALVCVEHSLWGMLAFTVGLGQYFYTGAAWAH